MGRIAVKRLLLCTGLLRRDDTLLLVRCRYDGEPEPLWVLPGGRHEPKETIQQTVTREFSEETGLDVRLTELAYVSESIDARRALHVLNCTFWVRESDGARTLAPHDPRVVEAKFVPVGSAPALLRADVLRIPVEQALAGGAYPRYHLFDAAEVAVPFFRADAAQGKR